MSVLSRNNQESSLHKMEQSLLSSLRTHIAFPLRIKDDTIKNRVAADFTVNDCFLLAAIVRVKLLPDHLTTKRTHDLKIGFHVWIISKSGGLQTRQA